MTTSYTPQQAHDDITTLFDAYYEAKNSDKAIAQNRRNENANSIVEQYVEANGKRPPASVLSRLATYLLLDNLTDSHPDKMSRDEYPIMSYGQTGRYFARNTTLKDVEYSQEGVIGTVRNTATGVKDVLLSPINKDEQAVDWRIFLRQILSEREYGVIISLYDEGMTQAETAEKIGVTQQRVGYIANRSLVKLRKTLF